MIDLRSFGRRWFACPFGYHRDTIGERAVERWQEVSGPHLVTQPKFAIGWRCTDCRRWLLLGDVCARASNRVSP